MSVPSSPGQNYIAVSVKQSSILSLLVGTCFSTLLVPMLIALLFFSNHKSRHQPIFFLNILALTIGLTQGAINVHNQVHVMLSPLDPLPQASFVTYTVFSLAGSMVVETILLLRLLAVYPPRTTPRLTFICIFILPALVKPSRLVNFVLFTIRYVHETRRWAAMNGPTTTRAVWDDLGIKLEWILQLVDNSYTSVMFLYRIQHKTVKDDTHTHSCGITSRLRGLFFISLSNFVFPVILNIVQLAIVFGQKASLSEPFIVYTINNYVSIIGIVFASVWSTGTAWMQASESRQNLNQGTNTQIESSQVPIP